MYEDTNPWAAHFAQEAERMKAVRAKATAKAAATRQYIQNKPQCILDLEVDYFKKFGKRVRYDDRTANDLTAFILDYLAVHGHYGARINIGGIMMPNGRWRTSGSTKGVADTIACVNGKFCQFEVKVGKDRPRPDQLEQQTMTRQAGGVYEFIHSATEFVEVVQKL